ncbi:hypothetical protein EDC01DRAFT_780258 [Geopyxis carbonaria]|nr:hypothetical protein EDC01DRAFT_780258 [Geopyxis carbonaria]
MAQAISRPLTAPPQPGAIHILILRFTPDTSINEIVAIAQRIHSFRLELYHPDTGAPVISGIKGGVNCMPDTNFRSGETHAFVFEFATEEMLSYFYEHDPTQHVITDITMQYRTAGMPGTGCCEATRVGFRNNI